MQDDPSLSVCACMCARASDAGVGRTHRHTQKDGQTDRQTDGQRESNQWMWRRQGSACTDMMLAAEAGRDALPWSDPV